MAAPGALRARTPSLGARLRAHLAVKVAVWLGLAVGICVPYFGLQHVDGPPPHALPSTFLDQAVPFSAGWIYAYVSLGLLVPLGPLVASTRADLARYAVGLALLCIPCFLIFFLFPILGPRPQVDATSSLYAAIVLLDRPTNSMPSLHAGLTAYSLLFIDRVLGRSLDTGARRALFAIGTIWGAVILYSTLATKQHWLLDLPAGVAIAGLAHWIVWRGEPAREDHATT